MAVYAAHLTRTRGAAPSVFQLAAEQALASSLKPALRRLVQYVCVSRAGEHWAERWFDELYLLLDTALQYHYLKHYAASFSESFYCLMRVGAAGAAREWGAARLPPRAGLASLALLALAPYLRDRLDLRLGRWEEQDEQGLLQKDSWSSLRRACRRVHVIAQSALGAWRLLQLGGYVCGSARSPTPALRALGLSLVAAPPPLDDDFSWRDLITGEIGFPALGSLALRGAQYGAFALQLLRWWDTRAPAVRDLPPPDPPERDARCLQHLNRCPLCRNPWRAPAVLSVSGYVFCYSCIARALRVTPRCPVTLCPASEQQLVRLYIDT